jgi:Bbp16
MFLDALTLVSDAQAFGAAGVSTNSIDLTLLTPGRQVGTGEGVGFGVQCDVGGTVAATLLEVISATDAALTAGILVHNAVTIPLASMVAGAMFFLDVPMGTPTQRFLGIRATTAGGTVTLTSWLTSRKLFSILTRFYPKSYTV